MRILVTGGAGSIGAYVVRDLLARGDEVTIVDDFNDFYDPQLKRVRLAALVGGNQQPTVLEVDITDEDTLKHAFSTARPEKVIHLAAWPSVRPSITHPLHYTRQNVDGTVNVFQRSIENNVQGVVFASSSSVYGRNTPAPYREDSPCDQPLSPYGASKRMGELYASMTHYLHKLPMTCLRFFTVYGPWVRPDMALWRFTEKIHQGEAITMRRVAPDGAEVKRDFTYVEDVSQGVLAALDRLSAFGIINIGNDDPVTIPRFVSAIEAGLGRKAQTREEPLGAEEAIVTAADLTHAKERLGYQPTVSFEEGAQRFTRWYQEEFLRAFPKGLAKSKYWN
ncbi:MAG: NAD-dependent epimerase/dehydratase [Parcubacteria group bacterium Gr01-1014_106]|nr:MAG: NAD-dependent epimerase/dehydratase [Parcubacteria group bacterium Gr01-1014_106]